MSEHHRAPQAFVLPDEDETTSAKATRKKPKGPDLVFDPEPQDQELVVVPHTDDFRPLRRMRWFGIFVSAVFALLSMWASLATVQLVQSFFALSPWLGWLAMAVAGLAGFAALAIILREAVGLLRLNSIEKLHELAARAINLNESASAESAVAAMTALYAGRRDMAQATQTLASHRIDIMDGRDRVHLAERLLLEPLDQVAHQIIARRARRVTLLTTVAPTAMLDMLFVAAQNFGMLRELATLYGGKPSTLSTLKLARMVASHLAVTGGLALSDNLIQHVVGKGLLGRLSARFGEGAVNGILTSRIGLATAAVCRPVPKSATNSDTLTSLLKEVLTFGNKDDSHGKD